MVRDHLDRIHGLYLSVQPIFNDPPQVEIESKIRALLPAFPENETYLSGILASAAPPRIKRQRLTALICFLSLLEKLCPPALHDLRLYRDEKGRPCGKTASPDTPPFDFNLTHTEGWVACALLFGSGRVGIDMETVMTPEAAQRLSARFFSEAEKKYLAGMPPDDAYAEAVTRLWTVKEALAKQDGAGYPLNFDACTLPCGLSVYQGLISREGERPVPVAVCAPIEEAPVTVCLSDGILWTEISHQ